jgi:hypothetical protein
VEKGNGILDRCEAVLEFLRGVKPTTMELKALNVTYSRWVKISCSNVLNGSFAESYHPHNTSFPPLAAFVGAVRLIQSSNLNCIRLMERIALPLRRLLDDVFDSCAGRSLFICDNGHVGISYPGVLVGDVVCVSLGCSYPIVLRPLHQRSTIATHLQSWEVVSVTKLAGLMNGEAIS